METEIRKTEGQFHSTRLILNVARWKPGPQAERQPQRRMPPALPKTVRHAGTEKGRGQDGQRTGLPSIARQPGGRSAQRQQEAGGQDGADNAQFQPDLQSGVMRMERHQFLVANDAEIIDQRHMAPLTDLTGSFQAGPENRRRGNRLAGKAPYRQAMMGRGH